MNMKCNILVIVALGAGFLAGCSNKSGANEKNFGAALSQYFEKKGELCLYPQSWPVDVTEIDLMMRKDSPHGIAAEMAALEAVGLAASMDIVEGADYFKRKIKRYTLTEAVKPFYREKKRRSIKLNGTGKAQKGKLCWGKKVLDKVIKWEGPIKLGDYQEANVIYTYRVEQLADWAKRPEIQAAFKVIKVILDGASKEKDEHAVKLTSQGWEALGLD